MWVGAAIGGEEWRDPGIAKLLASEFNMLTVGNYMKWESVHPEPGRYDFSHADALVAFARANRMALHAHVLVWENQLPDWLRLGNFGRAELIDILCRHIKTVVGHYRGQVYTWDVVNEAIADDGSFGDNLWLRTIGPEYIAMAFQWAAEADPDAILLYNDFQSEGLNEKSQAIYALAQGLQAMNIPIDGIGLQMHVWLDGPPTPQDLAANMQRLAALGLQVQITEMDVRTQYSTLGLPEKLRQQAEVYRQAMSTCVAAANCKVFVMWGTIDRLSWINEHYGPDMPLPFDGNNQPKPAYYALIEALRGP